MNRRTLYNIERRCIRARNFCANVWFFLGLGCGLRRAIQLARNTL